jgi:CRISPR-associated protein Csx10
MDDERIFHYEFIKRNQTFKGTIKCADAISKDLEAFLNKISTLRLGRSKNTEYGKVQFSFKEIHRKNEIDLKNNRVTLFFKSPVILRNKNGFYTPSEELLLEELGFSPKPKINKNKFFRTEAIENFRGIWGMKMPSLTAFKAGSTFTLEFTDSITQTQKDRLTEILDNGIGYRKNEGFGEIDVLNLSKEAELHFVSEETKIETIKKPEKTPAFMKKVLRKLTAKAIEQTVDNRVINDANAFKKNIPSNSLLSKIELMVKASDTFENFKATKVKQLREHAQKQLKKCRNKSITLFDLLTDEKHIQFAFKNCEKECLPQIETKAAEFDYQKRYISGLMRRLRKINKEKDAKKDGDTK